MRKARAISQTRRLRLWAGVFVAALATAAAVVLPAQPVFAATISFPDQNFEAAVAAALGVPAGSVTTDDMLRLTTLTVSGKAIQDLSGLQYASNLTKFYANQNQITDISPLAGLSRLTDTNLSQNHISDLSPLSGLGQLQHLGLADNQITDLSALAPLTSLRSLYLDRNEISDVAPLSAMTAMFFLSLGGNHVADVTPLQGLTSVETLYLQSNAIVDISPLTAMNKLKNLEISRNVALSDISPLETMTTLTGLWLGGTGVSDAELVHIAGLSGLTILDLSSDHLTDIGALAALTGLERLYLFQNQISDLGPLSGMTNLKNLSLNSNQISDLSPLAGLVNLTYLELIGNNVSQLSALVENGGLGTGDTVGLDFNHIDTRTGSQAMADIGTLVGRGARVTYWGQTPIDLTAPVTTVTGTDGGWHNHSVTLAFAAQDNAGGSGVHHTEYSTNGGGSWTTGTSITVTSQGSSTVSYRSVDNAGNVEATRSVDVKIDTTAPTVTLGGPAEGSVFVLGQAVTATWSASDALSGVDSTQPVGANAALDTGTLGAKTFTVSATDKAGNTASRTLTYTVAYVTDGLMQPVNADGSSIFKLGSTVPLKFSLVEESGLPVSGLAPRLYLALVSDDVAGTEMEAVSSCQADTGNTFREVSPGQYQFNLSTRNMQSGYWRVRIDLGNGAQMTGSFSLR